LAALYGTEGQLHEFSRRYGADYFVYDRGCLVTGQDSWRYKADALAELPASCPARLLWEHPEETHWLKLVYSDSRFRVFQVAP
jgi:hypothetical protein